MARDQDSPNWKESHIKHSFVYNSYDQNEELKERDVKIWFFDAKDVDMFQLTITPQRIIYVTTSDLKELHFPEGAKSQTFFSRDLAYYQDQNNNWFLHNPIDNIPLGAFDIPKLEAVCIRASVLKNVSYPGKLLFCKGWRQNKVFSIDQKDFLDGNY